MVAVIEKTPIGGASGLLDHGFSLIPLRPGQKVPLRAWAKYQVRRAEFWELVAWANMYPKANVACVTGGLSKVVVLDIDDEGQAVEIVAGHKVKTPMVRTPRGRHLYFRHPGFDVHNSSNVKMKTDFRGDGGYCVLPPSVNETGQAWSWMHHPDTVPFAPLPAWVLEYFPTLAPLAVKL